MTMRCLYLTRLGHKNLNYVMCGAYEGTFGLSGNIWKAIQVAEEAIAQKRKWEVEHTDIVANGGDSAMGCLSGMGGGGATGWEFFTNFDAYEKDSIHGTCDFHRWKSEINDEVCVRS